MLLMVAVGMWSRGSEFPQQSVPRYRSRAVLTEDGRECGMRSEQLCRQCLNMQIEILHIPKEAPGVQTHSTALLYPLRRKLT